jgi:hypothetical protein
LTSGEFNRVDLAFCVFHRHENGESLRYKHIESVQAANLPGAPGPDLWVGMALGQALQITESSGFMFTGVFDFRPHVFIERVGGLLGEFAVAPEPHSFAIVRGRDTEGFEHTSEHFVGGPGRPA